jgi:hypothetical protein
MFFGFFYCSIKVFFFPLSFLYQKQYSERLLTFSQCQLSYLLFKQQVNKQLYIKMNSTDEFMDVDGPEFIQEVNTKIASIRSSSSYRQQDFQYGAYSSASTPSKV